MYRELTIHATWNKASTASAFRSLARSNRLVAVGARSLHRNGPTVQAVAAWLHELHTQEQFKGVGGTQTHRAASRSLSAMIVKARRSRRVCVCVCVSVGRFWS